MERIVGIDLGTTNSLIAFMEGETPAVIPGADGLNLVPSVVALDSRDPTKAQTIVGNAARNYLIETPDRAIYSVKRLMGRGVEDVQDELKFFPFRLASDLAPGEVLRIQLGAKTFTPPEISAFILRQLKHNAERHLGEPVSKAVITVPAYFNDAQRQATKDAGRIAGLEVLRLVNEPTAAALAYGLDKKKNGIVAVYDLGGGTFDISILKLHDGIFEVIATNGDTHLGGDDLDDRIIEWLVAEFKKNEGVDLSKDRMALQRLKEGAEKAKIELSTAMETEINLPFVTADATGPKHMQVKLTRAKLEQLVDDLLQRTMAPVKQALADAGVDPSKIDEIVLVGGSTRMPKVQQLVREFFGKEPHKGVNPDEVVAVGAAVQGGVMTGDVKDMILLDVTPLSLGI